MSFCTIATKPTYTTAVSDSACGSYVWNGVEYSVSSIYSQTFTGANGCDSTVTVALTVLPVVETVIAATICNGETYEFEGDVIDQSGTYTATYAAENGCDSTVVLNLEILPELVTDLEATICAGFFLNLFVMPMPFISP